MMEIANNHTGQIQICRILSLCC